MSEAYQRAWRDSIENRDQFWARAAEAIDWTRAPAKTYDDTRGWFAGGSLNTASTASTGTSKPGAARPPHWSMTAR